MYNKQKSDIYISIDIETNGPYPPDYSMLSFGAVAVQRIDDNWKTLGSYYTTLEKISPMEHPDTMKWWSKHKASYTEATRDPKPPFIAIYDFKRWLDEFSKTDRVQAVASPAGYDFTFIYYYMNKYLTSSMPFKHRCLDLRSLSMAAFKCDYSEAGKEAFPNMWFIGLDHTHHALDDAMEQATLFTKVFDTVMG